MSRSSTEIAPLSVYELSNLLAAGQISAVEIATEALISRIEEKTGLSGLSDNQL